MADGEHAGAGLGGVGGAHLDEGRGGGGVEHGGHLIADQVPWSEDEGAGQAGSLQLAVADLVWSAAEQLGGQADAVGQLGGLVLVEAPLAGPTWLDDGLAQREPGVDGQAGLLEDHADGGALAAGCPVAHSGDRRPVEVHLA